MLTREAVAQSFDTTAWTLQPGEFEQLAGSNIERRAVTIICDPDATNSVFVVPTEAKARQLKGGVRVAPDRWLILPTTAPVYGYVLKAATAAVTVYIVELIGQVPDESA